MAMGKDEELQVFLDKIDMVGSMIKDLSCDDPKIQEDALKIADNYLEKNNKETCVNRSVINKQMSNSVVKLDKSEMSKEEFMHSIEMDIEERNIRRAQNTKSALAWKEKGNKHFALNENIDAAKCYSEAIHLVPDNIVYYTNRAQAYLKLKQYNDALKDCETALKLEKFSVKALVLKGRTLGQLKNFDQAITVLNGVLKIDSKQQKMINGYIEEIQALQQVALDEKKALNLCNDDENAKSMQNSINKLRKGCQSDLQQISCIVSDLRDSIKTDEQRTLFRLFGGFNIIHENVTLKRLLISHNATSEKEIEITVLLVELLSNTALDNMCNSEVISKQEAVLTAVSFLLQIEASLKSVFESVQLIYRLSQISKARTRILKSNYFQSITEKLLAILCNRGEISIVAIGALNNFALETSFLTSFQEKLLHSFIPSVIKMMECLYSSFDNQTSNGTFFPVIASSVSTISNIFRVESMRSSYIGDMHIWKVTFSLIKVYLKSEDAQKLQVVEACVGMLMNLSSSATLLTQDIVFQVLEILPILFVCKSDAVVERTCGVLSHLLEKNNQLLERIVDRKIYSQLLQLIKEKNVGAQSHLVKCLVVLTKQNDSILQNIYNEKVHKVLLQFLLLDDATIVGNTALCLSHCVKNKNIVKSLIDTAIIKDLLVGATNNKFHKKVRHNCALAIGKFTFADQRYLEQLRDLHGLEILHQVIRENNLI